jgi:hypothetical protein
MKEQRIVVEIDRLGRISADAEGFSGDACLKELERILGEVAASPETLRRKVDGSAAMTSTQKNQVSRKGKQ